MTQLRKVRTTVEIATPLKGKKGLGCPVRVVAGGALARPYLTADLFNEKGSGRVGLCTLPQVEGPPIPWLLLSATWSGPDAHDDLYHALPAEEIGEAEPQWLCGPSASVHRGTCYWHLREQHMNQLQLSLHTHPLTDDTGVFKLLLPRRLPAWLYIYPDACQCFLPL